VGLETEIVYDDGQEMGSWSVFVKRRNLLGLIEQVVRETYLLKTAFGFEYGKR
jgi:hypothetical protein